MNCGRADRYKNKGKNRNRMKNKLAISMFGQKRLSREGGIEIVVKELCTRMVRDGCAVTCYNRSGHHVSGAEYDQKTEYEGIRQKYVPTIEKKGLAAVSSSAYDSGLIIAEKDMSVQSWLAKEDVRPTYYKNRVNAGLHVIDPKVLDMVAIDADKIGTVDKTTGKTVKVDLDRQFLKPLAGTGKMFCYDSPEYVKDMGTPDRFHQVEEDFKAGRVSAKNLSNKQKAVFLDRDGTINKYVGFLRNINDFELIDGVAEAIKKINASGYLAIVVTNQPVVARGEVAFQELEEIHNKMETELGLQGAYLDAIYYCPHHPHKGYEGEVPELKIECDCRKPKPGMLLKAADDYNIDLSQSYMIGDGENDIKAGLAAGCKAILVNGAGTDAKNEDFGQADTLSSVLEFVDKYLQ